MKHKRCISLILLFLSSFFLAYSNFASIKNIKINEEKFKTLIEVKNIQSNSYGYIDMFKSINELQGVNIISIDAESESNNLICVEVNYIGDMNKFDILLKQIANNENVAYIKDIDIFDDGEKKELKMRLCFVNNR